MLRTLILILLVLASSSLLPAQKAGDSAADVEAALGRPQLSRTTSKGDLWVYDTGVRVTFKDGVVVAIEGLDVETNAPSVRPPEAVTVVPERVPPKPAASAAPAPAPHGRMDDSDNEPDMPGWIWVPVVIFGLTSVISNIIVLVQAFRAGVLWGLGSLFVPFVSLIFIVSHWSDVKKPVLINIASVAALFATFFAAGLFSAV